MTSLDSLKRFRLEASSEFAAYEETRRREFENSNEFLNVILENVKDDLKKSLSQAHDYVGLLRQIRQHVLAIFETKFPGMSAHEAADQLRNEGAIFYASELMYEKLDSTQFLLRPDLIHSVASKAVLHQYLLKYVRIYGGYGKQRQIRLIVTGESYSFVDYPLPPIGTAFQAILDNALKYAPASSQVDVNFKETQSSIHLSVDSLGPKINQEERTDIFLPGFRAAGAQRMEDSGLGLGLATAMIVSRELNLNLKVAQIETQDSNHPSYFKTTFSMDFEKCLASSGE